MLTREKGEITIEKRVEDIINFIQTHGKRTCNSDKGYFLGVEASDKPRLWPDHEETFVEIMKIMDLKYDTIINELRGYRKVLREEYNAKLGKMKKKDLEEHENTQKKVREEALKYLKELGYLDQLPQDDVVIGVEDQLPQNDEVLPEEALNQPQQNHQNLSAEVLKPHPKNNKVHLDIFLNLLRETLLAEAVLQTKENNEAQDAKALNQIQEAILKKALNNLQENQKTLLAEALNRNRENCKVDLAEFVNDLQGDLRVEDENQRKKHYEGVLAEVVNKCQEPLLAKFLNLLQKSLHAEAENETDGNDEAPNQPQVYYKVLIKEFANDLQRALEAENQSKEHNEALLAEFINKLQDTLLTKSLTLLRDTPLAEAMDRINKNNEAKDAEVRNQNQETIRENVLNNLQKNYQTFFVEAQEYKEVLIEEFVSKIQRAKAKNQPQGSNTETVPGCMSLFCELHTPKTKYLENLELFKIPNLKIKEEVTFEALLEQSFKLRYDNYELIMIVMDIIFKIIKFRFPSEHALFS